MLTITVGCPGAGKSTWADANLPPGTLRLERDRFRECMWGSRQAYHSDPTDARSKSYALGSAMSAAGRAWPQDRPIALTDTGIHWNAVKRFMGLRPVHRVLVFDPPWDVLTERNESRPEAHRVPLQVLRDFYDAMHRPDAWWLRYPVTSV